MANISRMIWHVSKKHKSMCYRCTFRCAIHWLTKKYKILHVLSIACRFTICVFVGGRGGICAMARIFWKSLPGSTSYSAHFCTKSTWNEIVLIVFCGFFYIETQVTSFPYYINPSQFIKYPIYVRILTGKIRRIT